jgi:hypothetical protein
MECFKMLESRCLLLLAVFATCFGCESPHEEKIVGKLEIYPKSGYSELEMIDSLTNRLVFLKPGPYDLKFSDDRKKMMILDPSSRQTLLTLVLPGDVISEEDGSGNMSFEFRTTHKENKHSYDVLGGRKRIIHNRWREGVLQEHCTWTSEEEEEDGEDADGNTKYKTVTVEHDGNRDVLYETVEQSFDYRILFYAFDELNIGQFFASGERMKLERAAIALDSCE